MCYFYDIWFDFWSFCSLGTHNSNLCIKAKKHRMFLNFRYVYNLGKNKVLLEKKILL